MISEDFKKNGYCVIKKLISDDLRDFITQYALFDEMQDFSPEGGKYESISCPETHSKYADPAMESLLLMIQNKIEEITDLKLYPTYSYYRVYRHGDKLIMHTDRKACEISVTMCFNYSYDDKKYTWPIIMADSSISLSPGDAVIYKGMDLLHGREMFYNEESDWQVQGFFHYVDANGPNAEEKYDRRSTIGLSKEGAMRENANLR